VHLHWQKNSALLEQSKLNATIIDAKQISKFFSSIDNMKSFSMDYINIAKH